LDRLDRRAREQDWSFERFAAALLKTEINGRDSHDGQAHIKAARFPARKTLEEFDFSFQKSIRRDAVLHLGQLDLLHVKEKVVLFGPPDPGSHCSFRLTGGQTVQPARRKRRCGARCGGPG
jgi:DNA replication protein DnaC